MPGARLTLEEREAIYRGLVAEQSLRAIAEVLERPASTVSREVDRDGGRTAYRACAPDRDSAAKPDRHGLAPPSAGAPFRNARPAGFRTGC